MGGIKDTQGASMGGTGVLSDLRGVRNVLSSSPETGAVGRTLLEFEELLWESRGLKRCELKTPELH